MLLKSSAHDNSQHHTVEAHFFMFKVLLPFWRDCPAFTAHRLIHTPTFPGLSTRVDVYPLFPSNVYFKLILLRPQLKLFLFFNMSIEARLSSNSHTSLGFYPLLLFRNGFPVLFNVYSFTFTPSSLLCLTGILILIKHHGSFLFLTTIR